MTRVQQLQESLRCLFLTAENMRSDLSSFQYNYDKQHDDRYIDICNSLRSLMKNIVEALHHEQQNEAEVDELLEEFDGNKGWIMPQSYLNVLNKKK